MRNLRLSSTCVVSAHHGIVISEAKDLLLSLPSLSFFAGIFPFLFVILSEVRQPHRRIESKDPESLHSPSPLELLSHSIDLIVPLASPQQEHHP